jgi:hypothetical protein
LLVHALLRIVVFGVKLLEVCEVGDEDVIALIERGNTMPYLPRLQVPTHRTGLVAKGYSSRIYLVATGTFHKLLFLTLLGLVTRRDGAESLTRKFFFLM